MCGVHQITSSVTGLPNPEQYLSTVRKCWGFGQELAFRKINCMSNAGQHQDHLVPLRMKGVVVGDIDILLDNSGECSCTLTFYEDKMAMTG